MPARSSRKGKKKEDIWQTKTAQTSDSQEDNNTWALPAASENHDNTWGAPAENQDNIWGAPADNQEGASADNQEGAPADNQEGAPADNQDNTWGAPADNQDNTWELAAGGASDVPWDAAPASIGWDPPSSGAQNEGSWDRQAPVQENTDFVAGDPWVNEADGNGVTKGKARRSGGVKREEPYIPETPSLPTKMPEDLLEERMLKMELQNDKIRERRSHVKADEDAFATLTVAERARKEADRKIQAQVNQSRELNAKRKLEKIANREWDRGKQKPDWEPGRDDKEGKPSKGNVVSQKRRGDKAIKAERPKDTENPDDSNDQVPDDTSCEPDKATHDYIVDDPEGQS